MYDAIADPYCYTNSAVLKNIPDIREQAALDRFEAASTTQRSDEPLPEGRLSANHYQSIHNHLFQDVYVWAGKFRTVRMSKDANMFCYPEHIRREMKNLFDDLRRKAFLRGLPTNEFVEHGAHFLTMLNAIHPFREGNGRTQMTFFTLLAHRADIGLDLEKLDPEIFLTAMIDSFGGNEAPLATQIHNLIIRSD